MNTPPFPLPRVAILSLLPVLILFSSSFTMAATPESRAVQEMVAKGIAFLEGAEKLDQHGESLGGRSLLGLAAIKSERTSSPLVAAAVAKCQQAASGKDPDASKHEYNYSLGLAIIFLCELDPKKYDTEINALLEQMRKRQRPDGSWSYPNEKTGDTSQTQYGVLSAWVAHKSGFPVPESSIVAVCNWLMRTQDPSGAFPYQGQDPGSFNRIRQPDVRFSMSPAALGSLYICADLLDIKLDTGQAKEGVPEFRKKQDETQQTAKVDVGTLKQALSDGNRWYAANFKINIGKEQYYYLYSLERYASFREIMEGGSEAEPAWYNQGVGFLTKNQAESGAWAGNRGPYISTAFAIMFLVRSTQTSIAKLQDGLLVGGQGLPKDLKNLKVREDGQVVDENERTTVDDLLTLMQSDDLTAISTDVDLGLARDQKERKSQIDELKKLVAGESYQARLLAVRTLARTGDLDNVPVLIYALSDPDERVAREARDGLRFVSRKFNGFGLPDRSSKQQKEKAQDDWARWYRSIRPHAEFEYR